jgi:glycosyltransferase involved in cell wall biosynthesis
MTFELPSSDTETFCKCAPLPSPMIGASFRCVSRELVGELSGVYGAPLGARVRVAEAALDLGDVPDRASARALLGVGSTVRLVVIVGRLLASKRVETALAAASLLDAVELVVVGDGPELARLSSAFPAARFVGRLERARALCWIAAADAVISASTLEGAPSALREARSLGVPVVAVASGDLRLWAKDDDELYVVAP